MVGNINHHLIMYDNFFQFLTFVLDRVISENLWEAVAMAAGILVAEHSGCQQ